MPVERQALLEKSRQGLLRYRGNPKNKIKTVARWKAAHALKRGLLVRQPCAVCGSEYSQMHHPDYRKPLEVEWLCRAHHLERHRGRRGIAGGAPPTALN